MYTKKLNWVKDSVGRDFVTIYDDIRFQLDIEYYPDIDKYHSYLSIKCGTQALIIYKTFEDTELDVFLDAERFIREELFESIKKLLTL